MSNLTVNNFLTRLKKNNNNSVNSVNSVNNASNSRSAIQSVTFVPNNAVQVTMCAGDASNVLTVNNSSNSLNSAVNNVNNAINSSNNVENNNNNINNNNSTGNRDYLRVPSLSFGPTRERNLSDVEYYATINSMAISTISSSQGPTARKIAQLISLQKKKTAVEETRHSFLGTPLPDVYRARFENRFYKQQLKAYRFLHRPSSVLAYTYHAFVFLIVITTLILTIFSTIKPFQAGAWEAMQSLEKFMIIWFISEYLIRLWSSSCLVQYRGGWGKLRYVRNPFRVLDLIVIVVGIVVVSTNPADGHEVFAATAFRGFHRLFQALQMIRLERQFRPWRLLGKEIYFYLQKLKLKEIILEKIETKTICFALFLAFRGALLSLSN